MLMYTNAGGVDDFRNITITIRTSYLNKLQQESRRLWSIDSKLETCTQYSCSSEVKFVKTTTISQKSDIKRTHLEYIHQSKIFRRCNQWPNNKCNDRGPVTFVLSVTCVIW